MNFKSIFKYAVILFAIFSISSTSCRKLSENLTEPNATESLNISQSAALFFNIPNNSPEELKIISESLKKENDLKPFVNNLIKELGIPIWDKAIIEKSANNLSTETEGSDTTIAYIGLVHPQTQEVNGVFICTLINDSTTVKLVRDSDYKKYGFSNTSNLNANHLSLLIMRVQNQIFQTKYFVLNDGRFFSNSLNTDSNRKVLVKLSFDSSTILSEVVPEKPRCVMVYSTNCPGGLGVCSYESCLVDGVGWTRDPNAQNIIPSGGGSGNQSVGGPDDPSYGGGGSGGGGTVALSMDELLTPLISLTQTQRDFLGLSYPTINPLTMEIYLFLAVNLSPDFTQQEKVALINSHINLLMTNSNYRDFCNSQVIYTPPQQYGDLPFLLQSVWFAPDRLINNLSLYSNISKLKLNAEQAYFLINNNFINQQVADLLNKSYSHLTEADKKLIATEFINKIMADPQLFELAQELNSPNVVIHPWMVELFKELALELGWKIMKKYIPGYGDWQSIKDAIEEAKDGDWLGMLSEVLNIVKKKVPALAVIDAVVDLWENIPLVNKAWKVFDKLKELPTNAFNSLLKTIKDKCGGLIGNLLHDDALGSNSKQAFLKLSSDPIIGRNFFNDLATDLGVSVHTFTASNGMQGAYFNLPGGFVVKFIPTSSGQNTGSGIEFPTIEFLKDGVTIYKFRFIN